MDASATTLHLPSDDSPRARVEYPVLRLAVIAGPARGQRLETSQERVTVGSAPECDLVVADPSVSRQHAAVTRDQGSFVVEDLGSTNGLKLGGARVERFEGQGEVTVALGETTLTVALGRAEAEARVRAEEDRIGDLVGRAPAMRQAMAVLRAVAPTQLSVLLTGESGTGKELAARAIHELSGRAGPLVVFDAATADPQLLRSDLFGHVKGAFTGASTDRDGAFRSAHEGTLFLDELGELPLDLQAHLLRALENHSVQPVGSDARVPVKVRVVAATHRDLPAMVASGEFRGDLYHRLAVMPLHLPPLRERREDLRQLAEHLGRALDPAPRLGEEALQALEAHAWPGNIRELRNVLARAGVLAAGGEVRPEHLLLARGAPPAGLPDERGALDAQEKQLILDALERHQGNRTHAARELGISTATLRRRLKAWGLMD
jgi:DNA-binding NtrC family response regulator